MVITLRGALIALAVLGLWRGPARQRSPSPARGAVAPDTNWCATRTESQLRDIRADLGGVRLSFETSPARGNYLFTPTYPTFPPEQRARIRAEYKARGYTHYPIGPVWERGYPGWKGHDYRGRMDEWVALLEELWRDDLIPVVWLLPDGPFNTTDAAGEHDNPLSMAKVEAGLTPLYQRPDVQRVTCVVVLGWEVTDHDWIHTMARATEALIWQARVFPKAYRYWHPAADNQAPCHPAVEGEDCALKAWRAMVPYLHGEWWQTGAPGGWLDPLREKSLHKAREAQFLAALRKEVARFQSDLYATGGLRGADGKPLDVIYGEGSAYFELNDRKTEDWGREWGRLAMTVPGVRGFGDGGR